MVKKYLKINIALFVLVLASWCATETLAWEAHFHPVLGRPLWTIRHVKVYSPYAGWQWAWQYGSFTQRPFQKAAWVFVAIAGLGTLGLLRRKEEKVVARWATRRDLRAYNLLGSVGVVLGKWGRSWLRYSGDMHTLVVAPSGSGKTRSIAVPTCLNWAYSLFVHDPKGELLTLSAGWRSQFSDIYYLNPTDPDSDHLNPWEEVRIGTAHEIRDLSLINEILVDPDGEPNKGGGEDLHFQETAETFLNGLSLHGLYTGTATNMWEFADLFMTDLPQLVAEMDATDHHQYFPQMPDEVFTPYVWLPAGSVFPHPVRLPDGTTLPAKQPLAQDTKTGGTHKAVKWATAMLKRVGDRELGSICSTAGRALQLALDQHVANMMSHSDFSLKEIRTGPRPKTIYFSLPYSDQKRLRLISRIIIQQTIDYNTQELDTHRWRMLQINDEVQAFGRMPIIPTALNYVRGYGYNMVNITPSLNELDRLYGENNNFIENSHIQVVYAPNDQRIAKRFSARTGELDVEKTRASYTGALGRLGGAQQTSVSEEKEPLATTTEVLFMEKHAGLLIVGNGGYPAKISKAPDYRDRMLRKRSQMPVPHPRRTP
jgi:type IV secretion system protein VirD4